MTKEEELFQGEQVRSAGGWDFDAIKIPATSASHLLSLK